MLFFIFCITTGQKKKNICERWCEVYFCDAAKNTIGLAGAYNAALEWANLCQHVVVIFFLTFRRKKTKNKTFNASQEENGYELE